MVQYANQIMFSGKSVISEQQLSRWKQFLTTHLPFEDSRIGTFLFSWMAARNGAVIPRKSDILPENFAALLPYMWIMKYIPEDGEFELTLAGEKINQAYGTSIVGMRHQEVLGERDSSILRDQVWTAYRKRLITFLTINTPLSRVRYYNGERCYVPIAADDGGPDYLLGVSLYTVMTAHQDRVLGDLEECFTLPCADLPD